MCGTAVSSLTLCEAYCVQVCDYQETVNVTMSVVQGVEVLSMMATFVGHGV